MAGSQAGHELTEGAPHPAQGRGRSNLIGDYGNLDSQQVNPATEAGKSKKPSGSAPEIPLAWPSGAGFAEYSIHCCNALNRRADRVGKAFKAEALSGIP